MLPKSFCAKGVTAACDAGLLPEARVYMEAHKICPKAVHQAHANAPVQANPLFWNTEYDDTMTKIFRPAANGFVLMSKKKYEAKHRTPMTETEDKRLHATDCLYCNTGDFMLVNVPAKDPTGKEILQIFAQAKDYTHKSSDEVAEAYKAAAGRWKPCTADLCTQGSDDIEVDLIEAQVVGVFSQGLWQTGKATQKFNISIDKEGSSAVVETKIPVMRSLPEHVVLRGQLSFAYIIDGKVDMVAALDSKKFRALPAPGVADGVADGVAGGVADSMRPPPPREQSKRGAGADGVADGMPPPPPREQSKRGADGVADGVADDMPPPPPREQSKRGADAVADGVADDMPPPRKQRKSGDDGVDTANQPAGALKTSGLLETFSGGLCCCVDGDIIYIWPPSITSVAPFHVRIVPERDPDASVSVVRFGSNGEINNISMGKMDELGFDKCCFTCVGKSVWIVSEGDAKDPKSRRRLSLNPFFPKLVGDVYMIPKVKNAHLRVCFTDDMPPPPPRKQRTRNADDDTCISHEVFEECIRAEELDGRRMTQLAHDAEGPALLTKLVMKYVHEGMKSRLEARIKAMACGLLCKCKSLMPVRKQSERAAAAEE